MKRVILLIIVLLIIAPLGCRKLKSLANININIPYSTQVTVPAYGGEGVPIPFGGYSATIGPVALTTNSSQYMAQYHTDADNILHVKLKSLSLSVLNPASESIDFIDTVRIYISAPGQPELLAAYRYGRATGQDSVALVCNDYNLKNYFLSDVMYIKLNGHFNRVPASGTTLGIYSVFNMLANPLY